MASVRDLCDPAFHPLPRKPPSAGWGHTHHDQCWREHLGCAIRRVETLELLLAQERMKHSASARSDPGA